MKRYILLFTFGISTFAINSCKKYLDVNRNENDPTTVPLKTLLPTVQVSLGNSLSLGFGFSNFLAVYTHQMTTREDPDQHGLQPGDFYLAKGWNALYSKSDRNDKTDGSVLNNLDIMIAKASDATKPSNTYLGIAKVLKAYAFSQLVDVFGDVPFSEFNRFSKGIKTPKFDKGADIYPQLIKLLDEAVVDLNKTDGNTEVPGADDLIYKGSNKNWIKAANTIKLKLLTQTRKVQDVKAQVQALLASPTTLINATSESFMLPYGSLGATNDRNPGFDDYTATQRSNHVSPWLYEIMKGYNSNIYKGIEDPRISYYIYNQLKPTAASESNTEYRDGPFISIYFGSKGQFRDGNQQNSISLFGIYPVGGRYDDKNGGTANASSGTGAAPYRFLTYADRLYLEAELIHEGVATGTEKTVFENAMKASMEQIDYVVTKHVKPTQTVPALYNTTQTNDYITAVLGKYDAASDSKKLEHIMTQKWLSNIGNAVDQYTDYRRTGYPIMFDPKNTAMAPGGFVQPPLHGNPTISGDQPGVPVELNTPFSLSIFWPQAEMDLNKSAPAQKNPATFKVFWNP